MAPVEIQRSSRNKSVNFIDNENCRKLSFEKRKSTLKKKAAELSTLCDVDVCMVCFGLDQTVETWPENRCDVLDLIFKYKNLSEEARKKGKQKSNLTGLLRDKKRKLDEKLNKITVAEKKRKICEESMNNNLGSAFPTWDERLNLFSDEGLVGLCGSLDSKLQELRGKLRVLQMMNGKAVGIMDHEVRVDPNNLNYDVRRSNGDYFHNQQIQVANCTTKYHDGMSTNPRWIDNSDFERPEKLGFLDENHNNNHVGMVNIDNNFVVNKYFSSEFAHATMGLNTEGSIGLMRESSSGNNYFQFDDHHFMLSHTSPASPLQKVKPISMRPFLPFSNQLA